MTDQQIGIGHNTEIGMAERIAAQLRSEYAELSWQVSDLLQRARDEVPATVETEADNEIVAGFVVDLRDISKRAENHREAEKAPYLRGGQAVDGFFKSLTERVDKAMAIIKARGDAYTARKVAEARAERERIAKAAIEQARADAEAARVAAIEAAELAAQAARARKPETIEKLETAAAQQEVVADIKNVDAMISGDRADLARNATLAKSADIARTRYANGNLSTAKQIQVVEIEDSALLDMAALWPLIKEDEKLRALKAWAKITGYKKKMAGAIIEDRDIGDYR